MGNGWNELRGGLIMRGVRMMLCVDTTYPDACQDLNADITVAEVTAMLAKMKFNWIMCLLL